MTREQKLGLIAGFTVVLLFGVLLADHLSRARTEPLIAADEVDEPLVIPTVETPARVGAETLPTRPRVTVTEPGGSTMDPVPARPQSARLSEPAVADRGASEGLSIDSIFERMPPRVGPRQPVDVPGFVRVEQAERLPVREPVREVTGPGERSRTHEVKAGDSLFRISERYYGNGHLWRKLAERNRGVVGADGGVRVGAVLTIPSRAVLTGEPASSSVATSVPTTVPEERTYTVKSGDTLSEISMKLLGTTRRMDELIAMNRDQIRDADDIRVGMKLRYRAGPSA